MTDRKSPQAEGAARQAALATQQAYLAERQSALAQQQMDLIAQQGDGFSVAQATGNAPPDSTTENDAKLMENIVDKFLKVAALIGVAGALVALALDAAFGLSQPLIRMGLVIIAVIVASGIMALALVFATFVVSSVDPTKGMRKLKQDLFAGSFAVLVALLTAGLWYGWLHKHQAKSNVATILPCQFFDDQAGDAGIGQRTVRLLGPREGLCYVFGGQAVLE